MLSANGWTHELLNERNSAREDRTVQDLPPLQANLCLGALLCCPAITWDLQSYVLVRRHINPWQSDQRAMARSEVTATPIRAYLAQLR